MKSNPVSTIRKQKGQATIEYSIIVLLVVVVLIAQPSVIDDIVTAIKEAYEAFVYAVSWSAIPISG